MQYVTRRLRGALLALLPLAACATGGRAPVAGAPPSATALDSIVPPTTRAWPVMGTMLEVSVWTGDTALAARALAAGRAAVARVDSLMSTYRPESELSAINRRAGTDSATVVSPETAEVLAAALEYAERTGGALDPTVGPLVRLWGFESHEPHRPAPAAADSARALVGWEKVRFDPARRTVLLPLPGMRLDFGAIAKGYALDRAATAMRAAGLDRGMVDLGGNVLVFGPPPPGTGAWGVGILDPRNPDDVLGVVTLDSGAVATSGDYEQFFVDAGVRYSHIFDPTRGEPARGVASATVVAPTGMASDALSTALFVLGPERGCAFLATSGGALTGIEALWVLDPGPPGSPALPPVPASLVVTPTMLERLQLAANSGSIRAPVPCRR